ncbi:MAG: hypothetical protein K0R34_1660 [Herbinix sp.]|jgi:hypothetical protein|nr:hypothetical protein [Herbinix sp.]
MTEELGQLDLELKGLFTSSKMDELMELLNNQPEKTVKEISDYNWNIVKKYYDTERFDLLFQHLKFVAYTCFIVEYSHQIGIIGDDVFGIMMMIYNDIYELKRQQG